MNILWIEDEPGKEHQLFIDSGLFTNSPHHLIRPTSFDEAYLSVMEAYQKIDLAIIDINLSDFELGDEGEKLRREFDIETPVEFLEEGGFHLYLKLVAQGFNNDRIVFLTANTLEDTISFQQRQLNKARDGQNEETFNESITALKTEFTESPEILAEFEEVLDKYQNSKDITVVNTCLFTLAKKKAQAVKTATHYDTFQRRFKEARLPIAPSIKKANHAHFHLWLDERLNPRRKPYFEYDFNYLTLRRGIIEGCEFLIEQVKQTASKALKDYLLFYKTTKLEVSEDQRLYVVDFLTMVKDLLPSHPSGDKIKTYNRLLKELSSDREMCEENFNRGSTSFSGLEFNFKLNCQKQMKLLRNWSAHNLILPTLTEQDVAYLFILAMRSWFNLPISEVYPYEKSLSELFEPIGNLPEQNILQGLINSYKELITAYKSSTDASKKLISSSHSFIELMKFAGNLNDLKDSFIRPQSIPLFYQSFWHGLFPIKTLNEAIEDTTIRGDLSLKIDLQFENASIAKGTMLDFLGKLIFQKSFNLIK